MANNKISDEEYKNILDKVPVFCVDIIVMNNEGEVLVVQRENEPGKGEWWVPGGRLQKNETIVECAKRKAKEELGLDLEPVEILGFGETIFNKGPFDGVTTHTVNSFVLMSEIGKQKVTPDKSQHLNWKFISDLDDSADPYMVEIFESLNDYFDFIEDQE